MRRLLGCVVIAVAATGLFVWWSRSDRDGASDDAIGLGQATVLACDQPTFDVGEIAKREFEEVFTLRNATSEPVRITSVGRSCACMKIVLERDVLAPGESASLTMGVEVRPAKQGALTDFREEALLHVDNATLPVLRLTIQGRYRPPVYFLTQRIRMTAPGDFGQPFDGELEVFVNREGNTCVEQVESLGPLPVKVTVLAPEATEGSPYDRVVIRFDGVYESGEPLPRHGTIRVRTSSKGLPEFTLPITLERPPGSEVQYSPRLLAFGIVAPGAASMKKLAFVMPTEGKYELADDSATGPGLSVSAQPVHRSGAGDVLNLECRLEAPEKAGSLNQEILVRLRRDEKIEAYKIPVSGFVKSVATAAP